MSRVRKHSHIWGKGTGTLVTAGNADVTADSDVYRQLAANAAAAGDSVGAGGSFTVSVLNDSTKSRLSRNVKAKNVSVITKAKNRVKATSRASASGAASKKSGSSGSGGGDSGSTDGESGADKQSDGILGSAGKLAGHVGTGGTSPSAMSRASGNRQSASTTEGGIEIAAALALNIQSIKAEALIDDGISVTAEGGENDGNVVVRTLTYNESKITANGSASKGKIGVGVAVAINVVDYDSLAAVGDSDIAASTLTVEAGMIPETTAPASQAAVPAKSKGWLMDLLETALQDLILDLAAQAGLSDLFGEDSAKILADQLANAVDAALDALLKGTGIERLLDSNPAEQLQKNMASFLSLFLDFPTRMETDLAKILPERTKICLRQSERFPEVPED